MSLLFERAIREFSPDGACRVAFSGDGPAPADAGLDSGSFDYLARLARSVADEREAERRRNCERARRHTPRELSDRGEAAVPEFDGCAALSGGTIQCRAAADAGTDVRDEFGVFEGDEVLLHAPGAADAGDAPADFPVAATVKRITDRTLDLVPKDAVADPDALTRVLDETDGAGLSSLLDPTTYDREEAAIETVRSNDRGDVGFLGRLPDGTRRLNVALTRAERFCGLVGDWDTLRDGDDGRNACADRYRDLYRRLSDDGRMQEGA